MLLVLCTKSTYSVFNKTVVLKEHGMLLQPKGLVALDANEQLISIFKKFKIPKLEKPVNCECTWLSKFNTEFIESTTYYTQLFQKIGNPAGRQKRFLGAIGIGLGFVDLLLTGISYGSLKHHINKVDTKLNNFIETQHSFDVKIIKVDEDIVHSISQLQNDVNASLKGIQTQIVESSGALMAAELKLRWETKLKEIFRAVLAGTITTSLSPLDLTPGELTTIIRDHAFLKNTYFAKNVFSLYKTATVTMTHAYLNILEGSIVVHIVMSFPMVTKPLAPYFEVSQTGIIKNNTCFLLETPQYVYKIGSTFYPLDRHYCKLFEGVATCYAPMLKNDSCLNNLPQCKFIRKTCSTAILFDDAGVLVSANKSEPITVSTEDGINREKTGTWGTLFIPWKNTMSVQIGQFYVEKPTLHASHLEANLSNDELESWQVAVSREVVIQTHLDGIMNKLQDLSMTSQRLLTPQDSRATSVMSVIAVSISTTIACLGAMFCTWTLKSHITCCKAEAAHEPVPTSDSGNKSDRPPKELKDDATHTVVL
jgi:hypothetical protein